MGNQYCYKYPRPAVTTDNVIFGYGGRELCVLLVERGNEPFQGRWALPGGFMDMDEDAETCARRELEEETGLKNIDTEQLYTFSAVDRDPRDRVVSVVYYALVRREEYVIKAGDDAAKAQWFLLSALPLLAFDHQRILQMAVDRLRWKVRSQPIGIGLLPERFKLSDLQQLYESVLQMTLDRRNFRRKILNTGLLRAVEENATGKKSEYYCFDKIQYHTLSEKGLFPGI